MPTPDPNATAAYNSMQAQAGLPPPQVIFPGQVSAAIAAQGSLGAFGSLFPSQTYQTAVGAPPIFQGPTGLMASMTPGSPYNPYAPANPYAGLASYGNLAARPSPFAAYAPMPPPAYGGLPGLGGNPFAPLPTASPFDTPYASSVALGHAAHMRGWAGGQAAWGVAAHLGGDLAGAAAGALLGSPLGPVGMLAGGAAGFLAAERYGVGRAAQNAFGNAFAAPRLAVAGAAQGLEHLSQSFVASGPNLHASGSGFGFHAAMDAAQGLADTANSADFRRDTRGRFNQQDVFRMTQLSGESGLLAGAGSPQGVVSRMRDIAKSLSAFMELAKEPDIQRAIQTMGQLRASGLNLHETMNAVAAGRSFARMAGTSFQGLSEVGGSIGAQTFQSMGMSMGLGHQVGMGAYGTAAASMNQGILGPQLAALVGGPAGLATLNSMHTGAQLQLSMVAPGLMSGRGGFDIGAVRQMLGGQSNLFGMTGRGASTLSGMAGQMGVEGLGLAVGMQPLLQDTLGRIVQGRGLFAGRNLEDQSILQHMRQMNLTGASGFVTAAQMLGMQGTTAVTRATEVGSGAYWDTQRSQLMVNQREARADADRERALRNPRFFRGLRQGSAFGDAAAAVGGAAYDLGVAWEHFTHGGPHDTYGEPTTDDGRRRMREYVRGADFRRDLRGLETSDARAPRGVLAAWGESRRLARAGGAGSLDAFFSYTGGTGREADIANYRAGGAYASRMLSATPEDQRAAMADIGQTFGNTGALLDFTRELGAEASRGYRGGDVALNRMTFGLLGGPSAMRGSSIERAFRERLRRQGLGEDEIGRRWETQGAAIAQQHAAARRLYGETDTEAEVWRATADQQSNVARGSSRLRRLRDQTSTVYADTFGGHLGHEGEDGVNRVFDAVEGFGPEGSARQRNTRQLMVGLLMAQIAKRAGGTGAQARADRQITDMVNQARGRGVSDEDLVAIGERVEGLRGSLEGQDGVLAAARGFVERGGGLDPLARAEAARRRGHGLESALSGFRQWGQSGGVLGDVFRDVDENNMNEGEVLRRIRRMTAAQRRRLREERGMRGVSEAFDRIIDQNDTSALGDVFSRAVDTGEQAARLRREYDEGEEGHGVGAWFRRTIGTYEGGRERWVQDRLRQTSAGERSAAQQRGESSDAEAQVRASGLGVASDQLLDAARELRDVARTFRDVNQSSQINALVGRQM